MRVLAAAAPVLILEVVIAVWWLASVLERELRRQGSALREALAEIRGELEAANRSLAAGSVGETEAGVPAAMLEGFDNLMSYTEKTARGRVE